MILIHLKPEDWCKLLGIEIMDPDGWDRRNYQADWAKPLTFHQFMDKADNSTVGKFYPDRKTLVARVALGFGAGDVWLE